jgi:flagellar protein FlbD
MITVTRINGEPISVNCDLIEFVESTPDTVITLTTGQKFMVRETVRQVTGKMIRYERAVRLGSRRGPRVHHIAVE